MDLVHYSQPAEEAGLNDGVGVSLGWAISCGQLACTLGCTVDALKNQVPMHIVLSVGSQLPHRSGRKEPASH